jgi:uncharacterized protein (DUF1778 family)
MTLKARLEIRCHEDDKDVMRAAADRDGARSVSAWLLALGRRAARTAAETLRSVNASVLVR